MPAATLEQQRDIVSDALGEAREKIKAFIGKTHPAAKAAWFFVGALILSAVLFTGWHNWRLYSRGADTATGKTVAIIPALLLDGSIVLLLTLLLTYFKDRFQWWTAVIFNALLFLVIGANTSIDFSMNANEPLSTAMHAYLRWGVVASFLGTLLMWEIIIHLDPVHRMRMEKAKLEMKALQAANAAELRQIELEITRQTNEIDYQETLQTKMHASRMKATASSKVDEALTDFEESNAVFDAMRIRGAAPKAASR